MLANIVIGGLIALAAALAVRSLVKDHKNGSACSCGCAGCASSEKCHEGHEG